MSTATTSPRDPLRWSQHGACLHAPDLPWTADDPAPSDVAAMAAVCGSCPVRLACAAYAITQGVTAGFWAGASRDALPLEPAHAPEVVWVPHKAQPRRRTARAAGAATWEQAAMTWPDATADANAVEGGAA